MPVLPSRVQAGPSPGQAPAGRMRAVPPRVILQKGPAFGLEQTNNRQINRIQQSVRQATGIAQSNPLGACNVIEGLSLSSGNNVVSHGLPQAWRGALLTTPSAAVTWYVASMTPPALNDSQLLVNVSANVTCSLLIW